LFATSLKSFRASVVLDSLTSVRFKVEVLGDIFGSVFAVDVVGDAVAFVVATVFVTTVEFGTRNCTRAVLGAAVTALVIVTDFIDV
jgi:hypothetical protein